MFPRWTTFAFCLLLSACATVPRTAVTAPDPDPVRKLQQDIVSSTRMPGTERAIWGIVVHSLARNQRLFQLNEHELLVPASSAKLVTLATAADAVGWDYRFETTMAATGPVTGGVLQGDVIVIGSGDPAIGGRGGDDLISWVEAVKAQGIHRIEGRIIGDDDAFEDPRPGLGWTWDDLGYVGGALFGALNLEENRMVVKVAPGPAAGAATTLDVEPHAANRALANRSVTGASSSNQLLWPEQRPGEPFLTIAGSIPAGAPPASLSVAVGNPTFWFASVLRNILQQNGVEVAGEAFDIDEVTPHPNRTAARPFYTYRSHTLAEIAQPMMKDSINLYAEAVFRLDATTIPHTNDAAIEGMGQRLRAWGIDRNGWQLVDGSGISRRDVVAPETLALVLQRMYDPSGTTAWMTSMPIAGRDGTLAGRMKNTLAEGNVHAKTGTMSNIRTLAGYVRTRDDEPLAFVIMVNNFEGSGAEAIAAIDAIAVRLASFSRGGN